MIGFTRNPGPLSLSGIRVAGLRSLVEYLGTLGCGNNLIAADLSLGAWRSHQVASEFCSQLALNGPAQTESEPSLQHEVAGLIQSKVGRLIDSETLGDRVMLEALRLAREVHAALVVRDPTLCCVFVPRFGFSWDPADLRFVRFLGQALQDSSHRLLLVSYDSHDPVLPEDWCVTWSDIFEQTPAAAVAIGGTLAAMVPGVVTPAIADALNKAGECVPESLYLPGDYRLVAPELRCDPNAISQEQFDSLATVAGEANWLAAYANYFRGDQAANLGLLWERARCEFSAGGFGITIKLLERAMALSQSVTERAVFLLLSQGARIASEQFAEAAEIPDPAVELSAPLRGWLFHTKGWALTMQERAAEAEVCLRQARWLLKSIQDSEEYLYLRNISALNYLKLGDANEAIRIEQDIRSALQRVESGRWQLRYINSLNLARLYKRKGDFENSEQFYRDAFDTSYGMHSDGDQLYRNVCQARLEEAGGKCVNAFHAWVRASLFWLACAAPEAIGRRITGAILASFKRTEGNLLDNVSSAFTSHLLTSAANAGFQSELLAMSNADPDYAPAFVSSDYISTETTSSAQWSAISGPGGWVLGSDATVAPIISSSANRRLRSAMGALLALANTAGHTLRTVVLDDQLGRDIPSMRNEILGVGLRLALPSLVIDGRNVNLNALRNHLESHLRVRLGSAVDRLIPGADATVVTFKRYHDFQEVSGLALYLLGLIQTADRTIEELRSKLPEGSAGSELSCLRMLERERIIELSLPELADTNLVTD
jgi:tetratricopeptide (TPR) repeat protein